MKLLAKFILLASISLPVGASIGVAAYQEHKIKESTRSNISIEGDYYVMSNDKYTLKLDSYNLSFTISKGDITWDSGVVLEEDRDNITSLREAFLTSPVTIYSYNSSGGESSFSAFDMNHPATLKVSLKENKIVANMSLVDGKRTDPTLKISFNINYVLLDDGLEISITDIVQDEGKNVLSKMAIYPGFNMSHNQIDGYFLIPDGCGSIVDLSTPTYGQSAIALNAYGKDIGISASNRTYYSSEQLSMPMFAMVDSSKSAMVTIEEGQEYSELNAKCAGMIDDYNAAYFRFIYRETTYQYLGLSDTNRKAIPQKDMNNFNPVIRYHLYDERLEYYDIAKKYRSYLLDNDLLNEKRNDKTNVRLEFLMNENKKALFGKETFSMTSPSYIKSKMEELVSIGNHFSISLKGYTSSGYGGSYPYSFPLSNADEYKKLGSYLSNQNIDTNYVVDLVRSSTNSHGDKLAMNMSEKLISSLDYVNGTSETYYRINPNESISLMKEYQKKIKGYNAKGMDFTSIGYELFSTYYHEKNDRTAAKNKYIEGLKQLDVNANMRKPNLYMFPYFDGYLDTPTSSSGFMMETENVPFLSMVLGGYKSLYSSPINLNYLGEKQLLELVDYNVCPSYLLTEKDTTKLIDSPSSSYIYSSVYDVWKEDIISSYSKVINILKEVEGQTFVKREMINKDVYKNTYENGKCIIVNYSNSDVTVDGHNISKLSSEVISL